MSAAFKRFLSSETGPKTVHFWWSLVFAGANDMVRPVEKVSGSQQLALLATGAIWTRWSFVIRPQNMLLASVNFLLGTVAGLQIIRIYNWRRSLGDSPSETFKYILNGTPTPPEQISAKLPAPVES